MARPFADFTLAETMAGRALPSRAAPGEPFLSRSASRLRVRLATDLAACWAASALRMSVVTADAGDAETKATSFDFDRPPVPSQGASLGRSIRIASVSTLSIQSSALVPVMIRT